MHLDILEVTRMEGMLILVTMTTLAQRIFQSSPESLPLKNKPTANVAVARVDVEDNLGVNPRPSPLFGTGSFCCSALGMPG